MIIGISGKINSGKDTVGSIIQYLTSDMCRIDNFTFKEWLNYGKTQEQYEHKWEIKKYAGKLKEIACILTGCTLEQLENQEFKKLQIGPDWGMTYRELLQKLGTEAMRNGLHNNVWVNALMADYKGIYKGLPSEYTPGKNLTYPNWIITDMRFPNEFDAVKSRNGITIRVNRINFVTSEVEKVTWIPLPGIDIIEHPSETALDNHNFDYVIDNNGSISDLIFKVREILTQNQII